MSDPRESVIPKIKPPLTHHCIYTKTAGTDEITRCIAEEPDLAKSAQRLTERVEKIAKGDDRLFAYVPGKRPDTFTVSGEHRLHSLAVDIRGKWEDLYAYFPKHSFNPYIAAFLDTCEKHPRLVERALAWKGLPPSEMREFVTEAQAFVDDLRACCRSKDFLGRLHRIDKRCRKNYDASIKYVRALFEANARHLILRLDLSYHSAPSMASAPSLSLPDVRRQFAKLQRWLHETFPVTGLIWKLEYGIQSGHHYHLLLMLNGHLVQLYHDNARRIKTQWESEITEGRGLCYICNPKDYPHPGIGMINYYESDLRKNLEEKVLPYLTKADFWLSYEPGGRTFGKGLKPPPMPKVGRPRSMKSQKDAPEVDQDDDVLLNPSGFRSVSATPQPQPPSAL